VRAAAAPRAAAAAWAAAAAAAAEGRGSEGGRRERPSWPAVGVALLPVVVPPLTVKDREQEAPPSSVESGWLDTPEGRTQAHFGVVLGAGEDGCHGVHPRIDGSGCRGGREASAAAVRARAGTKAGARPKGG